MYFYETNKRYNQFSSHLKSHFGEKVYKVTLDAGFTCPNRDGLLSKDGCIFCDSGGSFSQLYSNKLSIEEQLKIGISKIKERYNAKKFMSYFQAYSNTYKPVEELEAIYNAAIGDDIVGLSIGTRPDCVDQQKLDLISRYTKEHYTWVEYGLQSVHDKSLNYINRGHDFKTFEKAWEWTKERNINGCAHVILGLPSETKEDMLETARVIGGMGLQGVKIHLLCVLEGTKLAQLYEKNEVPTIEEDEYVELVCDFLELLPQSMTIQRLAGNGLKSELIAPKWLVKKWEVLNKIDSELERRNSFQGSRFKG